MPRNSQQSTVNSEQSKAEGRRQKDEKRSFSFFILHTSSFRLGTLPVVIVAFIVLVVYAFVAWFKPPSKPDATWVRILDTGEFRVGVDPSFPPFESDDAKGNLSGLDIALANEFVREWASANATPIRVEYVYSGFDGLYDALRAKQFDAIISALPYDPKKTEDVYFSHAYFNGGPHIIVRETDTTTKTYYDLMGKPVGVELGSSGDAFARRWQRRLKIDLRTYNAPADALRALRLGQVDAVFTDLVAFNDFVHAEGGVKQVGAPLVNELAVIAVRKDEPTLLVQINAVIDAMKRDGRMEQLYAEWLVNSKQ
jgi:polar amino acid transport system substrate-binding protein